MAPAVLLRSTVALAGRFPALSGVDLTVADGEVVALVGANGAGKTSVLRLCAGLLPVASGEAVVLGHDVADDPGAVRRSVGLLGHAASLYEELSALENLRFALRAAGERTAGVDEALERVGLVGRLRRTAVGRLSQGQRRRVALALLVARRPQLWLLDEPHAGLDVGARRLVGELVAETAAAGGTVLLASHELEVALPMADRVVHMAGGRIVSSPEASAVAAVESSLHTTPPSRQRPADHPDTRGPEVPGSAAEEPVLAAVAPDAVEPFPEGDHVA